MPDSNRQLPPRPRDGQDAPGAAAVLDQLVRERGPTLRKISHAAAGDDADEAFQRACVGFLMSFDPAASYAGLDGAQRYLATAIYNHASKLRRSRVRRERALLGGIAIRRSTRLLSLRIRLPVRPT